MVGFLWGLAVALLVAWVVVKLVLGIDGAALHLLLAVAVLVALYALVRTGASRRA